MKNVVYASNDRFFPILMTSIVSLLEHNENVAIWLLSDNISNKNINRLGAYTKSQSSILHIIDIHKIHFDEFENLRVTKEWPLVAFVRLHIEKIITSDIEKVVYLDCDTIVNESIDELFEMDVSNYYVAGVTECMDLAYKNKIGLKKNDIYVNSGVLIINLKQWRVNNLSRVIDKLIFEKHTLYKYPDQDIINVACREKIMMLPLKFNVISQLLGFKYEKYLEYRNSKDFYSEKEYIEACNKPYIVHYASGFTFARPWFSESDHPYANLFIESYKKANGKMDFWGKDNRTVVQKIVNYMYGCFPNISIKLLKIMRRINNR